MLFSMNWISDFVDLSGFDLDKLIQRFTLSTAEVEDVFHMGENIKGVVSGRIVSCEPHPDSKKLHLLKVSVGDREIDCVCGAKNAREGIIVPFAMAGGCVCGNEIREATVAGYRSCGMCCSAAELNLSADNSGLLELPSNTPVGVDITELFDVRDTVFEVDNKSLTNRPDLWGHYGVAREFAAMCGRPLALPQTAALGEFDSLPEVPINIIDREHTLRYTAITADNITVKKSPVNMMIRLHYCGLRAINLLADLTNYVMLELGQPLHAFDRALINKIEVKRFEQPFEFKTLDGTARSIDRDMLMICSGGEPCAVAGVMGGLDSEIRDDTCSVLLESAVFDGVSVRKTSSRLGLRTDASMRYEKMLDPELAPVAAARYIRLLNECDPGARVTSRLTDDYVKGYPEIKIDFDKQYIDRYTGIDISADAIQTTLNGLGFSVERTGDRFSVGVPSWRRTKDITIKADIVEEITRIYGYDNFAVHSPASALHPVRPNPNLNDIAICTDLLAHKYGLHEVHSYIWCDAKKYREFGINLPDNPKLLCPPSPDLAVLRRSLVPTQLAMLCTNKGFSDDYGIFEAGRAVEGKDATGRCDERRKLAVCLYSKKLSEKELYFKIRDIFAAMIRLCTNSDARFARTATPPAEWCHPKNTADILCRGQKLGYIGVITPSVLRAIDKKASVVCGEIEISALAAIEPEVTQYVEPSKFPSIDIDLSLMTDAQTPYSSLAQAIAAVPDRYLKSTSFVDCYCDPSLPGKKVFTIRLNFSSDERTLSRDDIRDYIDGLTDKLASLNFRLTASV